MFSEADYLDPLAVCKDRKPYPHKLSDAIDFYKVDARNSHRAIDDVDALLKVTEAEEKQRNDVYKYVNILGYNPKYGLPSNLIKGVRYIPQPYGKPKLPNEILPYQRAIVGRSEGSFYSSIDERLEKAKESAQKSNIVEPVERKPGR